jgi:hypothetical protein
MRISASAFGFVDLQRMVMLWMLAPDSFRKPTYLHSSRELGSAVSDSVKCTPVLLWRKHLFLAL